jgi:hypothetical protein
MARESFIANEENRDIQIGICVIFGILGIAFYPLAAVRGIVIIAAPFIITWALTR